MFNAIINKPKFSAIPITTKFVICELRTKTKRACFLCFIYHRVIM